MIFFEQASASIDAFMLREHPLLHPTWLTVAPSAWDGDGSRWRQEARDIVRDFESRIGFGIKSTASEHDGFRTKTLNKFRNFLDGKALAATGQRAVARAKS